MRVATSILLDCACCSGDNDLHALERDLHVPHGLGAEVPSFSGHERPQERASKLTRSTLMCLSGARPTSGANRGPYTALTACDFP